MTDKTSPSKKGVRFRLTPGFMTLLSQAPIDDLNQPIQEDVVGRNNDLKHNPDFLEFVKSHQWSDRRKFGFKRNDTVFDWIETAYKPWIGNGLYRAIFKDLDNLLYIQFHKALAKLSIEEKHAVIERLKLPAEKDKTLAKLSPQDQERQLMLRETWRHQTHLQRHPPIPQPIIHPEVPKFE